MEQIFTLLLPIFGVMAAGYFAGKLGILGQESSHALNAFVYYIAMPVLLFNAMAGTDILGMFDLSFLAIFMLPQLLVHSLYVLAATRYFGRGFRESMLAGMAASWGNTVYMGIPLAQTALGDDVIPALVIIIVVQPMFFMVGTLLILDISGSEGNTSTLRIARSSFISFIKNPAMIAAMAGMFFSATAIPLHPALASFTAMLAPAAAPCALFAIGLFLTTQHLNRGLGDISLITLIKLIVSPALVVMAAYLAVHFGSTVPDKWIKGAVLLAATPTGTLVFVIAQKHRLAEELCSGAILVSSVLSVLSIALLLSWL